MEEQLKDLQVNVLLLGGGYGQGSEADTRGTACVHIFMPSRLTQRDRFSGWHQPGNASTCRHACEFFVVVSNREGPWG